MNEIEIFLNQRNELVVKLYAAPNSMYNDSTLIGKDAYIFIEEMAKYPIRNIIESSDQNNYAFFEYAHFNVTMKNYVDILYKDQMVPLNKTIKLYFEKKNLEKNKNKRKKVNRKKKHSGKNIIMAGLTFVMLVTGVHGLSKQDKSLGATTISSNAGIYKTSMIQHNAEEVDMNIAEVENSVVQEENQIHEDVQDDINMNVNEVQELNNIDEQQSMDEPIVTNIQNNNEEVKTISINYDDRSVTNKANLTKTNYGEIINKYSKMFGLDPKLVTAIATQERGEHSSTMDKGGATGLMQIQNSVWVGNKVTAYNFDSNSDESVLVDEAKISNVDTNIKIGCMIFQNMLKRMDYNILAAVQSYNMGNGNVNKILTEYSMKTNRSKQEILNDTTDYGWLNHRDLIRVGDRNYVENVLSWIGSDVDINVTKPDGTVVNLSVNNQDTAMKMSR